MRPQAVPEREAPVALNLREYGTPRSGRPAVVLLHGLFGSAMNWHGLAQRLGEDAHVLAFDLRNHGRSPHHPVMSYESMAADVLAELDARGLDEVVLIGHSMGGKVAMWAALTAPDRVARLAVLDIAPVTYPNRFEGILTGLQAIDTQGLASREQADETLARYVASAAVRQFLLANLQRTAQGWSWRMNLPAIVASMPAVLGFPPTGEMVYPGPALILRGERSDYVAEPHREAIASLFPAAELRTVEAAGHWLYAERPEQVWALLSGHLSV